jgi:hypothetical protein
MLEKKFNLPHKITLYINQAYHPSLIQSDREKPPIFPLSLLSTNGMKSFDSQKINYYALISLPPPC